MRILITGITGYIGSNLARHLLNENEVFGLVREPINAKYINDIHHQITLLPYDGSAKQLLKQYKVCKPDLVYHLATYYTGAHHIDVIEDLISSNISLGAYLLEAMSLCGTKNLIYAASIMQHYEGYNYRPLNLYAATKHAFEDLLTYYTDTGIINSGILVLSDTYGPKDERPKILNLIYKASKTHSPIDLSDGSQDYDLVYIDDVIRAFIMAGKQLTSGIWKNKTFQIFPQEVKSLREVVDLMLDLQRINVTINWGARLPVERTMKHALRIYPPVPGWKAKISLVEGFEKILNIE